MAWKKRSSRLRDLAEGLIKVGALQFGTFTLSDGSVSSYYVNMRGLPSYPGVFKLVVESMTDLMAAKAPKTDAICGAPMTGLVIASPVAVASRKPLVYARLSKNAGEGVVEGEIRPNWRVLVMDDLATSGKTILASARAIQQEGGTVKHAAVLIDRLEGAQERLSKEGITLHSVTDMIELSDTLFAMELITKSNLKTITKSVGGH